MHAASACHSVGHDVASMRPSVSHVKAGVFEVQVMKAANATAQVVTRLASQPQRQLATLSGPKGQKLSMAPRQ
jgi:hypothetical protein